MPNYEISEVQPLYLALYLARGASLLYTRGPVPEVKVALTQALDIAERAGSTGSQLECPRGLSEYELTDWPHTFRSFCCRENPFDRLSERVTRKASENADAQAGSALRYLGNLAASQSHPEKIVDRPIRYGERSAASRFEFDQRLAARGSLASVLWLRGFPDQAVAMAERQRQEAEDSHHAVPLCSAIVHHHSRRRVVRWRSRRRGPDAELHREACNGASADSLESDGDLHAGTLAAGLW